jgi:hypothetical protein
MLTDAAVNAMLDLLFPTGTGTDRAYLSAHTDYHATGGNLHGSVVAGAWAAASARQKAITAAIDLPATAPVTIKWIGAWGGAAGNTFRGMFPNGSTGDKSFQVDLANNRIYCEGHGWSANQKIVFHGDTPPTGLTAGVTYFVKTVTAGDPDYFDVSATAGGSVIDITGQAGPNCNVSDIVEEVYSSNGTHRVSTLTINN